MSNKLIDIFTECVEAIEQGTLSVEDCLAQHPEHRAELLDLLLTVMRTRAVPNVLPPSTFRVNAKANLLAKLEQPPAQLNGAASPLAGALPVSAGGNSTLSEQLTGWWQRVMANWPFPKVHPAIPALSLLLCLLFALSMLLNGSGTVGTELAENEAPEGEAVAVVIEDEATAAPADEVESVSPTTAPAAEETAVSSPTTSPAVAEQPGTANDSSNYLPVIGRPLERSPQTAVLEVTQGVVELQQPDGTWQAVNQLTAVSAGQRLKTAAFSSATLNFYDGSMATLAANSELTLETINAQKPDEGLRTIVMTQWLGESEHSVDFRNDNGSRYEVKSPTGSGIARGTTFKVRVKPNQHAFYTVTKGKVDVTNRGSMVSLLPGQVTLLVDDQPPLPPSFFVNGEGVVEQTGDLWKIGGQTFQLTGQTVVIGNPQLGDLVRVEGRLLADGTRQADLIVQLQPNPENTFSLTGELESRADGAWQVAGQLIIIVESSLFPADLAVGETVLVEGIVRDGGAFVARQISRIDDQLSFTIAGVVEQISADEWTVSGQQIAVTAQTQINGSPTVGATVSISGQIIDGAVWQASRIQLIENLTPTFEIMGIVQSVTPLRVAGVLLATRSLTAVPSNFAVGDLVRVSGQILPDGSRIVTSIIVLEEEEDRPTTVILIGILSGRDPWVVNGITLIEDDDSLIAAEIGVGMLVVVEIERLPNGVWLVKEITLLNPQVIVPNCFVISDRVRGLSGNQLTLLNWPAIALDNDELRLLNEVRANAIVTFQLCTGVDSIIINDITIIYQPTVIIIDPGNNGNNGNNNGGGSKKSSKKSS